LGLAFETLQNKVHRESSWRKKEQQLPNGTSYKANQQATADLV
jgi:hypothetical protein